MEKGRGVLVGKNQNCVLQRQISRAPLRRTSENAIMVFQSCVTTWTEPNRGIVGLRKLEFVGVGGLPIIDELEPLAGKKRTIILKTTVLHCTYRSWYSA
jgi:hypothetical protein